MSWGAHNNAEAPDAQQLLSLEAEIGLGKLDRPTDPSGRWTIRLPVYIAWSDRYAKCFLPGRALPQMTSPRNPVHQRMFLQIMPMQDNVMLMPALLHVDWGYSSMEMT